MHWSAASHVGRVRDRNEDAFDVIPLPAPVDGTLFIVADGLGGQQAGDIASSLAVRLVRRDLLRWAEDREEAAGDEEILAALTRALQAANDELIRQAVGRPDWRGMGTTVTAVRVQGWRYQFAHVGDSRLYLFHRGTLRQVSRDHALVQELIRSGQITVQQARRHPSRHVLTQAVGMDHDLDVDTGHGRLQAGDALLLCTDGLTEVLGEDEMVRTLLRGRSEPLAERLVELANRRGGPDNVTVIVIFPAPAPASSGEGMT